MTGLPSETPIRHVKFGGTEFTLKTWIDGDNLWYRLSWKREQAMMGTAAIPSVELRGSDLLVTAIVDQAIKDLSAVVRDWNILVSPASKEAAKPNNIQALRMACGLVPGCETRIWNIVTANVTEPEMDVIWHVYIEQYGYPASSLMLSVPFEAHEDHEDPVPQTINGTKYWIYPRFLHLPDGRTMSLARRDNHYELMVIIGAARAGDKP